jgi:phenylalanyl-tRNA synthetase beta chain
VTPPSHRFDISIEADLIEELARIVGSKPSPKPRHRAAEGRRIGEQAPVEAQALEILAARGYHEAITYAFVDPALQTKLFPAWRTPALSNPIASDMAVMRASLWPGLIKARSGKSASPAGSRSLVRTRHAFLDGVETDLLAGIAMGRTAPEQWGAATTLVDFFDVKQDLEALFARTGAPDDFGYVADALPACIPAAVHESRAAERPFGWLGELHPELVRDSISHMRRFCSKVEYIPGSGRQNAAF